MPHQTTTANDAPEKTAVIIPVFNNERTIEEVVRNAVASGLPVLVVDDAATDRTPAILATLADEGLDFDVVRCAENRGKAGALRIGFQSLRERGFDRAVSVDADLQHDLRMLRPMLEPARAASASTLVVGCRWPLHPEQPRRNLVGRTVSNVAIRLQCGIAVGDAPCGFRVWPLDRIETLEGRSGRYAWEQEMITRLAWSGTRIRSVDIPAIYHAGDDRVSHYRFARDWPEGIAIYLWLLVIALVPRGIGGWSTRLLRRTSRLISPGPLRGDRPEVRTNRWTAALSIGFGALLGGIVPASPWMLAVVAWIGWRWHAGLAAILLAAHTPLRLALGPSMDSWYWPAIVAWCIGGFLRPAGRDLRDERGVARGRPNLVDPAG